METILEDLCSRIFDIQMCLECAANGGADQKHIQDLTTQMCKIENELNLIEEEVNAQMPLVERVESVIERLEGIYKASSEIQQQETEISLENQEDQEEFLQIPQQQQQQPQQTSTKSKKGEQPTTRKSISKIPTKINETNQNESKKKENQQNSSKQIVYFRPVTEADAKKLIMYRTPINILNDVINEMNELLEKKHKLAKTPKNRRAMHDEALYNRIEEDIEQGFGISITSADIQNLASLKKNQKKFLGALNELGRITSSTTGSVTRYYPKE